MKSMRRMSAAFVLAAVLAVGFGTAGLEAAKKPGGGDPNAAICAYLKSVLAYPNLSPSIRETVQALYDLYGCK